MAAHPDGLLLFKAESGEKAMEQPGWIQNPSFQYVSGLPDLPAAILVIDAPARRTLLFVPPAPLSFGMAVSALDALVHPELIRKAAVDGVRPWSEFVPWVQGRIQAGVSTLYLDAPRRPAPTGVPPGMPAVQGSHEVWAQSLSQTFPRARLGDAAVTLRTLRWKKSSGEVSALRQNAGTSAEALRRGMRSVHPGLSQRRAEAAVVAGCLEAGANGPSFWPWMMAGSNGHFGRLVQSFFDYEHINRRMEAGELVRADVGCMGGGYGGDVGRTVPVSGAFSAGQARVWDLLVTGYRAGVSAMADGVPLDSVRAASRRGIAQAAAQDPSLAELAAAMNAQDGIDWHIHGIGIESAENPEPVLVAGAVLAYEPMFVRGPDAYYLEDMILVTANGAEVLTTGLPYTAAEMAAFLTR